MYVHGGHAQAAESMWRKMDSAQCAPPRLVTFTGTGSAAHKRHMGTYLLLSDGA